MIESELSEAQTLTVDLAGGMVLSVWCKAVGISLRTAKKWILEGKLPVVHRYGMTFITAETIKNFFKDDGSRSGRGVGLKRWHRARQAKQLARE
jgi:predicted site-specific integrase-resolvase